MVLCLLQHFCLTPLTTVYWDGVDDFTADIKNQYANNPDSIQIAPNGKYYTTSINPNLQQNPSGLYNKKLTLY